jgi:hypothetical protein
MLIRFMKKRIRSPWRRPREKGSKPRRRRRSTRFKSSVPGTCVIKKGTITWALPRKLRSLNVLCSRLSRYGDTKAWESEFTKAALTESDGSLGPCSKQRLKLEVIRVTPTKAFFLDRTNLAGGVKGLEDALIRLEYLVDDCEEWEDGPYVSQEVATDGKYTTIIRLSEIAQTTA